MSTFDHAQRTFGCDCRSNRVRVGVATSCYVFQFVLEIGAELTQLGIRLDLILILRFSGHTNRVYSLQFDGVHVVSGSLDTSIRVWDVETGACRHALMVSVIQYRGVPRRSGKSGTRSPIWSHLKQCFRISNGLSYNRVTSRLHRGWS